MKIALGELAALEPGESEGILRAHVPPTQVGIAQVDERVFAFDSRCPHRAADLTSFGQITTDCSLRCGVHGHVYDLETGTCSDARDCDPKHEELIVFAAEQDDGSLWISVPDDHFD